MGVWGSGIYSDDFAMDLRSTIRAVARLPYDGDRLAEIVAETEPAPANNPQDENHALFWLVLGDQFAKHGILSNRVREQAVALIDADADIAMRRSLGASESDLKRRRKQIDEVRARILAPPASRKGTLLRNPQPLLMTTGDVFVYPTFSGRCRNPYFATKEKDRLGTATPSWTQDTWAAMVIVACGRAFEFFSWYRPLTVIRATVSKPTLQDLMGDLPWKLRRAGTCSPLHFKRLEFERIGSLSIDAEKFTREFPNLKPGIVQAVSDISIAGQMHVLGPEAVERPASPRALPNLPNLLRIIDHDLQRSPHAL